MGDLVSGENEVTVPAHHTLFLSVNVLSLNPSVKPFAGILCFSSLSDVFYPCSISCSPSPLRRLILLCEFQTTCPFPPFVLFPFPVRLMKGNLLLFFFVTSFGLLNSLEWFLFPLLLPRPSRPFSVPSRPPRLSQIVYCFHFPPRVAACFLGLTLHFSLPGPTPQSW